MSEVLLTFTVPGRPVSWERKRVDSRGRRNGKGRVLVFTDDDQEAAKRKIQMIAQVAARTARLPKPTRETRFEITVWAWYPDLKHGDVDRAAGLPLDALEGVVYVKDRQVKDLAVKIRTDRDRPRVDVEVRRAGE